RWRSRDSDQGDRRCLLTRDTLGLMGETGKRFRLAGAWAPWQDGLRWSLRGCRAWTGPGNMQHEKYPEESQDDHQGEKWVWNHGVPPSHGVIQGALYPVFGGRELAADWRYTTCSRACYAVRRWTSSRGGRCAGCRPGRGPGC